MGDAAARKSQSERSQSTCLMKSGCGAHREAGCSHILPCLTWAGLSGRIPSNFFWFSKTTSFRSCNSAQAVMALSTWCQGPGQGRGRWGWGGEQGQGRMAGEKRKERERKRLAERWGRVSGRKRAPTSERSDRPLHQLCPSPLPSLAHLLHHPPSLGHHSEKALDQLELLHGQGLGLCGGSPVEAGVSTLAGLFQRSHTATCLLSPLI